MALAGAKRIFDLMDQEPETDEGYVTLVNAKYIDGVLTETDEKTGVWAWKHFHQTNQYYHVPNIITRWAPPSENDTKAYIRTVLRLSGLGGKENLPQPSRGVDTERLVKLLAAMTTVECGIPFKEVDVQAIRKGYELAFPGKRSYARTQPVEECVNPEDWLIWDEYRDW